MKYSLNDLLELEKQYIWLLSRDVNMPFEGFAVCDKGKVFYYFFNSDCPVGTAVLDFNDKYYADTYNRIFFASSSPHEKQMHKKPNTHTENRGMSVSGEYDIECKYVCPDCKYVVGDYEWKQHYFNYCPNCGQALDWGGEE